MHLLASLLGEGSHESLRGHGERLVIHAHPDPEVERLELAQVGE
jgi:hypothetical protein